MGALLIAAASFCSAQVPGATDSLFAQGNRMSNALIKNDYRSFAHYMHPKLMAAMGGRDSVASKMAREMKSQPMTFESVKLDSVSSFVKVGAELQATVRQHSVISVTPLRFAVSSTLICFSEDNGLHWTYVDASAKKMERIRRLIPNVSPKLVIGNGQQQVLTTPGQ